jgi:hypothetical protein
MHYYPAHLMASHCKPDSYLHVQSVQPINARGRARQYPVFPSCNAFDLKPNLRASSAFVNPSDKSALICFQLGPAETTAASITATCETSRILSCVRFRIWVRRPDLISTMIAAETSEAAESARRPTPCRDSRKICLRALFEGANPVPVAILARFSSRQLPLPVSRT